MLVSLNSKLSLLDTGNYSTIGNASVVKHAFLKRFAGLALAGMVFPIHLQKPKPMKTNFKFYFNLILATSFLSAIVYGFAQSLVEKHITIISFGLLATTVICLAGMMRSNAALSVETSSPVQTKNA